MTRPCCNEPVEPPEPPLCPILQTSFNDDCSGTSAVPYWRNSGDNTNIGFSLIGGRLTSISGTFCFQSQAFRNSNIETFATDYGLSLKCDMFWNGDFNNGGSLIGTPQYQYLALLDIVGGSSSVPSEFFGPVFYLGPSTGILNRRDSIILSTRDQAGNPVVNSLSTFVFNGSTIELRAGYVDEDASHVRYCVESFIDDGPTGLSQYHYEPMKPKPWCDNRFAAIGASDSFAQYQIAFDNIIGQCGGITSTNCV